jgi:hypothetical protein
VTDFLPSLFFLGVRARFPLQVLTDPWPAAGFSLQSLTRLIRDIIQPFQP